MPLSPRQQVERDGYYIAQVLQGDELARIQQAADVVYDSIHGFTTGDKSGRYVQPFLEPGSPMLPFAYLAYDKRITGVIEQILGGPLVWEGAALLCSAPAYTQGWHRDVLQIPQDKIDDDWFTPGVFFNNIQLNMGFYDDASLWAVPGSHNRPLTPAEAAAFAGTKHSTADTVEMPGAIPIDLKAGQCVFYNNNIIHRGHNARHEKRVTYHSGYARKDLPPTWHFYVTRLAGLHEAFTRALTPEMSKLYDEYQDVLRQYPDPQASWAIPESARR
ncbi:MAG: phytanoyl-CoA dioxygenase family protein [Planctomycetes bacterium]|nr:phytanoyl-CoA dioxygenase family protein [Planctomycetota bacterium]